MPDLLDQIRADIHNRMEELRPVMEEYQRLSTADRALGNQKGNERPFVQSTGRRGRRAPSFSRRAPRGQNRAAILALVGERPGVSVGEIASVTGIAKPTVYATVSKLKRDGTLKPDASGVKLAKNSRE